MTGTWSYTGRFWNDPAGDPVRASGTSAQEMILDGRFLMDRYCEVHGRGKTYFVSLTLTELDSRLDPDRFLRVHRSHLVNLDAIESIRPHDERRLVLFLRDGARVVASRSGSQRLRELST